jgi:hypothetical protein
MTIGKFYTEDDARRVLRDTAIDTIRRMTVEVPQERQLDTICGVLELLDDAEAAFRGDDGEEG